MTTNRFVSMMLGSGALLSLAMLSAAVAQDTVEEEPAVPQALPAEAVEVEMEDVQIVVVQGGDAIIDEEEEFRQQIIKELMQSGISLEEAEEMLGISRPQASQIDDGNAVIEAAADGSELYLPIGSTKDFALEPGTTLALPFMADGAGMLTVAYGGPVMTSSIEVLDASGRRLDWDTGRSFQSNEETSVRHALIPIGAEGEYTIRLAGRGTGDLTLGAEWLPFPQVEGVRAVFVPRTDPVNEVTLVADRMVTGSIDQSDAERYYMWCRFDATEDGQLAVLANADQGDITMSSFNQGQYRNAIEHVDSDMNGSVANEGLIVDVVAGQTYYVRVEMRSGQRCNIEVRTGWVALPE